MTEEKDLKEEMQRLKEEMQALKQQLHDMSTQAPTFKHKRRGIRIDIDDRLAGISDYVNDVMAGVAEGIESEIEKSVLIHASPGGVIVHRDSTRDREPAGPAEKPDLNKAAYIMSALGQEYRLKILAELMTGGKYISDLQNILTEITASTLSSHLNILQEAGLVVQERVRGRYLITITGRMAYKMSGMIAKQRDRHAETETDTATETEESQP